MWATLLKVLGVLIGVAGAVAAVVKYVRGGLQTKVDLAQRDAALQVETQRREALEAAAEAERQQRRIGFDAEVARTKSVADAARLLHDASTDDPEVN